MSSASPLSARAGSPGSPPRSAPPSRWPFLLLSGPAAIWTSFGVSMFSHFAVGAARSVFTGRSMFRSGVDMLMVGFGVAAIGYLVGELAVKYWLA